MLWKHYLVPMPLMFTVLGMVVPKPQQGVKLLVELVVVFVVRVNLVQMLAKLLTKSDDGWTVRAIGKLACKIEKFSSTIPTP